MTTVSVADLLAGIAAQAVARFADRNGRVRGYLWDLMPPRAAAPQ